MSLKWQIWVRVGVFARSPLRLGVSEPWIPLLNAQISDWLWGSDCHVWEQLSPKSRDTVSYQFEPPPSDPLVMVRGTTYSVLIASGSQLQLLAL